MAGNTTVMALLASDPRHDRIARVEARGHLVPLGSLAVVAALAAAIVFDALLHPGAHAVPVLAGVGVIAALMIGASRRLERRLVRHVPRAGAAGASVRWWALLTLLLVPPAMVVSAAVPGGGAPGERRLAGANRVGTALAVSAAVHDRADTVVLARADDPADALAGGPLAAALGGPLLLTTPRQLPDEVIDEIARLQARRVVLLGGTGAIRPAVAATIEELGIDVERIAGSDRFDTARRVAARVGGDGAYLVQGSELLQGRWADAVAVSGLAAFQKRPILLVHEHEVPEPTRLALRRLGGTEVAVVGGPDAVSGSIVDAVARLVGEDEGERVRVRRLAGADRYRTSRAVAQQAMRAGADDRTVWVATGRDWPDALAAGPAAAARGGILLLVPGDGSPAGTTSWLDANPPSSVTLVGGSRALETWRAEPQG